ncbi:hypothetical protein CHS0354_039112 [Potamilus streckersoni]|uniref:Ubiquitin-like protease family profile domain-containing protein n=1 Tax=Potamilus streckersoni TaxID=2493646 RepID=A0AAE0TJB6_9BIVA|nr:hypothetical protein CHS0354_039112 [Potamilus streckersoni]
MLSSLTSKLKSFLFPTNDQSETVVQDRKRKRILENSEFPDGDIASSSKRSRLAEAEGLQESQPHERINTVLSVNVVKKMSDWVHGKASSSSIYFWRKENQSKPDPEREQSRQIKSTRTEQKSRYGLNTDVVRTQQTSTHNGQAGAATYNQLTCRPTYRRQDDAQEKSTGSRTVGASHASATASRGTQSDVNLHINLHRPRHDYRFTASETVRLDERERYRQLLQQFTSVPLESKKTESGQSWERKGKGINVPALPKFYFKSNASILGSNYVQDVDRSLQRQEVSIPRQKVVASQFIKLKGNGLGPPPSERTIIDLTEDSVLEIKPNEEINIKTSEVTPRHLIKTESRTKDSSRVESPRTIQESQLCSEEWLKELKSKYAESARERQRKIAEEEIKLKVFAERRQARDEDLEKQIRERMRLTELVKPAVEEPVIEVEEEEDKQMEEFPELTPEMEKKINYALMRQPAGEVLVEAFRLQLTRNDFATLSGLSWLNDEIINFYMNMLIDRGELDNYPKVYAFNTFFYPKIMSAGYSAVRRWTKSVDIFSKDFLVIPVHLGMHWCLCVVDFKKKSIFYYDSMGGNNYQCLEAIKKYLCDEMMDKKKQKFDLSGWKTEIVKDIPHQMNGSDCGMFACKYAEYITRRAPITFTQEHMPYFRRRMVYEILTKRLL